MRIVFVRFSNQLWQKWDDLFRYVVGVRPLERDRDHLFCLKKRRYLGAPLSIDDVDIHRFDPILELHINNRFIIKVLHNEPNMVNLGRILYKEFKRSLPALAAYFDMPRNQHIKALYGITLIHRGIERFGFHVVPIQNSLVTRILTWYLQKIFCAFNPDAPQRIQSRPEKYVPRVVLMTRKQLMHIAEIFGGQ